MQTYEVIIDFLKKHHVPFEEFEHEPVYTSEQAAAIRGLSMKEGAKSLLVKVDGTFFLLIIPGDKRLDSKKVKQLLSGKSLRFATPEEVVQIMHCEIGACYPFGNLIGVKQYVDPGFQENEYISFNPGIHTKSIRVKWRDYEKLVKPTLQDLSKSS